MLGRIIPISTKKNSALARFPQVHERRKQLVMRADAATLSALTVLEARFQTPTRSDPFMHLEHLGFGFERLNGSVILKLPGEALIEQKSGIFVDNVQSLRTLFYFREQWKKSLQNTAEELWELWNTAPVGYHTLNTGGIITAVNATEAKLLGYQPEEMIGRSIFDFIHPAQREIAKQRFADKLAGNTVSPTVDRIYLHQDGSEINMSAEDLPHLSANGEMLGVKTVLVDISRLKMLQESIYQLQKKEDLGELAAGFAHEFGNIIAAIRIGNSVLRKHSGLTNPDMVSMLEAIEDSCGKARKITEAVLYYARMNHFHAEVVQPKLLAEHIVNLLSQHSQPPIEYILLPQTERPVIGGEQQIYQAVLNLCFNARDALSRGGSIVVRLEERKIDREHRTSSGLILQPGEYVSITVKDDGSGILPEDQPRIFDPFFTTKEPDKATGLGLSVVLGIMEAHRGGIEVKSDGESGTEMILYFPAA